MAATSQPARWQRAVASRSESAQSHRSNNSAPTAHVAGQPLKGVLALSTGQMQACRADAPVLAGEYAAAMALTGGDVLVEPSEAAAALVDGPGVGACGSRRSQKQQRVRD